MSIKAVIFDLDGVIVSTDEFHYRAWARFANEEGFPFSRDFNERFRGVSRAECLEIFLQENGRSASTEEKEEMLNRKNSYYREMLGDLSPCDILPNVIEVLSWLSEKKIPIAIGSSSKNTAQILEKIGLSDTFQAVVDGNQILRSKPDPEVFLLAAKQLQVAPENCLVVEDADAGVAAALSGGMVVLGVGSAASNKRAHFTQKNLTIGIIASQDF
jgi:beta-phosphoglucomutase